LIRDYREGDEFTVKYDISQQIGLMNPTQTGVYDVLLNDGKYAKCLLIFAPYGIRGQSYAVTLVKLEKDGDSRACVNVPARKLFIRSGNQEEEPDKGWFDLLPDDAKPANGVKLVAITRNGGSLPLSLERNLTDNYSRFRNNLSSSRCIVSCFSKCCRWHNAESWLVQVHCLE
jgi:hypothetical protein